MEFGMVKEEGGRQQQTEDHHEKVSLSIQYDCTVSFLVTKFYPIHHLSYNMRHTCF